MKKSKLFRFLCVAAVSCTLAVSAYADHTITLDYRLPSQVQETLEVADHAKLGKAVKNQDFKTVSRQQYGMDFEGWYVDPDCREAYNRQQTVDADMTLYAGWTPWDEERQRVMDEWLAEMDLCKVALNNGAMYTWESFEPFLDTVFLNWRATSMATDEGIAALREARASLVEAHPREEVIWELWGQQIPQEDTSGYSFYLLQDVDSYRPVINAFLLENQAEVKGNIIICPGGGFTQRSVDSGGYCVAKHMNALGYNCFLLQYRVQPYDRVDSYLDLQRAIRCIKYHAQEKQIGAIDRLAAIGFSAGGFVVSETVGQFYGDTLPTAVYPDYVCDEIDRVNADVSAIGLIYGVECDPLVSGGNPKLPPVFMAVGSTDSMWSDVVSAYGALHDLTPCELHVYEGVPHAFGMTDSYVGADQIDEQLDAFLSVHFGIVERRR